MEKNIKNLFDLKKKVVIITGGSGFLGSEFSFALSDMGALPVIFDKNEKSLKILKKRFSNQRRKGSFHLVDINNEGKLIKTINLIAKKYKKIDCLINSASFVVDNNIQVRPIWHLNHLQKPYKTCQSFKINYAQKLVKNCICLPSSFSLTKKEQSEIIKIMESKNGLG